MEMILKRIYNSDGTNGSLYINGKLNCYTIELPWLKNHNGTSCIPEGIYNISLRFTQRLGQHLQVNDVPGRSLILIHPANNATKQLRGCIAPVRILTGNGEGIESKMALKNLIETIRSNGNKTVFLNIQKQ